jgi:hypothetical protein
MKVNQIVNEHKKGVRAKIYNKKATVKAQGSVPLYGPDKQEAKLTPYKPKKIDEAEEIKIGPAPANMQQATDPSGKVIATGPADKIAAVAQAAKDGVDFTPNSDDGGTPGAMEETGAETPAVVPLGSRFDPRFKNGPEPYTIDIGGTVYKFAGRNATGPGTGEIVKVPAAVIGVRGLSAISVELGKDGMYYPAPATNESADNQLLQKMLVIAGLR